MHRVTGVWAACTAGEHALGNDGTARDGAPAPGWHRLCMHHSTAAEIFLMDEWTGCKTLANVSAQRIEHDIRCMAGAWLLSLRAKVARRTIMQAL